MKRVVFVAAWIVVAATAALFVWTLCGSGSPAAAQSPSTDSNTPAGSLSSPPAVVLDTTARPHRLRFPLLTKPAPPPPTGFGVQVYSRPTSASAALPLAAQAHASWIRWPLPWAAVEYTNTTPDNYDVDWLDTEISTVLKNGQKLVITVDGNPSWAATLAGGKIDKTSLSEFAQFMGAMVERYDGDGRKDASGSPVVDYWEFYNEPDNGSAAAGQAGQGYWGHDGAAYARMLCAVYPAMKAASSRVKATLGGIAYDAFEEDGGPFVRRFLDDVLAAGGGKCIDALAFHYYPAAFESYWTPYGPGLVGKTNYLRSKLESYGVFGLPMIVTEAGHHSNDSQLWPSTPEIQADYVVKLFTQALASGLEVMAWWTWSDYEIIGYQFANGLLDQGLQPKPSYYAYQTAARQLGQATFDSIVSSGELGGADVQAYLFQRETPLYVMWANEQDSESISLPGKSARVVDYLGSPVAQVADSADGAADGRVRVAVGSSPVYVEVTP
jgi:hypothetical protein